MIADHVGATPPRSRAGGKCVTGRLLDVLDDAERAALLTILADPRWDHAQIARMLAREGHGHVHQWSIGRHRRHGCLCREVST